jgi:hypothetical protein
MRSQLLILALIPAVACEKEPVPEPRFEGPMPIVFGDCAGPTVAWLSGPRPSPFTAEEAEGVRVASGPTEPPPSAPPEEAKVAAESPGRATPPPKEKDPARARQQALEQARSAGLLTLEPGGAFASLTGTGDIASGFDDTNIYGGLLGNEVGEMNGGFGFGRSGFGPGGGGTGWGTIGTGRYGTIGHGAGTGSGYGVGGGRGGMRGRTSAVPTVSIGQPNAQGDLDKAIIRRYIKRNQQKIQYCYEKELLAKPSLAGTVMTNFLIKPNGNVSRATGNGVDPNVASCVADVIRNIEFPKPKGGGNVQVNYPFIFRLGGGGMATTPPSAAKPAETKPAATAPAGAGAAAGGSASSPAKPPRELYRPDPPVEDDRTYQPGAANPLRAEQAALTECFRKHPTHHGAIVVELGFDAAGGVTQAGVHGLDDERVRACVVEVAKRVKRAGAGPAAQRCSVAFGQMPVSALPAVDITGDAISLAGKQLASPQAIANAPSPPSAIPELVVAVRARGEAAAAATGPVVSIYGPVALRPLDSTPMKVVARAMNSVLTAGDDFVLAARRGGEWLPVQQISLPVVPVPFGTGSRWHRVKGGRGRFVAVDAVEDRGMTLSILITRQHIWVGLSRVNEFQELVRGESQSGELSKALAAHKSKHFAKRTDLEIAAADDVSYGELVNVIDLATKAGFVDWQLTDPQALTARPASR